MAPRLFFHCEVKCVKGKMKTIHGIYKKHGREEFLSAAKAYSSQVKDSIEATISEMESRWYDSRHTMTEADKMVSDYNNGLTALNEQSHAPMSMGQAEMKL